MDFKAEVKTSMDADEIKEEIAHQRHSQTRCDKSSIIVYSFLSNLPVKINTVFMKSLQQRRGFFILPAKLYKNWK